MFLNSLNLLFDCLNFVNEGLKDPNFNLKCKWYGGVRMSENVNNGFKAKIFRNFNLKKSTIFLLITFSIYFQSIIKNFEPFECAVIENFEFKSKCNCR